MTWSGILPRYFADGRQIGLSLTGGVDSRMILSWAPCSPGDLMCHTFSGPYRDCMDLEVARQVAGVCGHPHETIYVGHDFLYQFPNLAEESIWLSDGTMDVTGSVDLYVQRIARLLAPVRMTGTNGGEIMRSLIAFKPAGLNMEPFDPDFGNMIRAAGRTYTFELDTNRLSFTAFKQAPWYMNTKFVVERSQISLRMPYFDNDFVALVYRAPKSFTQNNDLALRLIADGNPALSQIETDRALTLKMVPGLTHAKHFFQQFTFKLEYAYDYGMPQWLARVDHLVSPLQPENFILGRHKIHHFRKWYRDELSGYIKSILLDPTTLKRPYLNGAAVEKMVLSHTKGTANHTREIHKILSTELMHRLFIDRN
jgi:asparagine synthase (glutamine-hydrolysing)